MSPLNKRSDVKSHVHSPFFTKVHFVQTESQPDATGASAAEPDTINANPSGIDGDFVAEHSSPGIELGQGNALIGSIGSQAPATSKSVQS